MNCHDCHIAPFPPYYLHNKIKKCLQGIKVASRLLTSAEETATTEGNKEMETTYYGIEIYQDSESGLFVFSQHGWVYEVKTLEEAKAEIRAA